MRRRRRHLHVDTFPFLAVLLCAMGSLILVLLIMDRKAKLAARNKAREEAVRLAEERRREVETLQTDRADAERRRREDWEKERDALHQNLAQKHEQVTGQVANVRKELDEAVARLQAERDRTAGVEREIQTERIRVGEARSSVEQVKADAARTAGETGKTNETLTRMTADLGKMESAVRELKAAKQAEGHTYSVVPYHGRQGSNRRPLYIECTGTGIIFHPDKLTMSVPLIAPTVRTEVLRRIAALPKPAPETPYLLLLVRPNGINCYYELQSSLRGEQVEFGYECIDADWALDFPAQDDQALPQPWMTTGPSTPGKLETPLPAPRLAVAGPGAPLPVPAVGTGSSGTGPTAIGMTGTSSSAVDASRAGPAAGIGAPGIGSTGTGGRGTQQGPAASASEVPGIGSIGLGGPGSGSGGIGEAGPGGPGIGQPEAGNPGPAFALPTTGSDRAPTSGSSPSSTGAEGTARGTPGGGSSGSGTGSAGGAPGGAIPDQDGRMPGAGPPPAPQQSASPTAPTGPGMAAPTGAGAAGPAAAIARPQGGTPDAATPPQTGDNGPLRVPRVGDAWASEQRSGGQGDGIGSSSFQGPQAPAPRGQREPPPRRPARLTGDRDWIVFIECRTDRVVLYPSRESFTLSAATTPGASNPLRQAVLQLIQRRQGSVLPGQPPYRPQLRFLLRPTDLRTLHQVIPVLQPLGLPMTEQNLAPDDDVQTIVAGS
jgi:hypothetical protein